jgi:hypothetical protein
MVQGYKAQNQAKKNYVIEIRGLDASGHQASGRRHKETSGAEDILVCVLVTWVCSLGENTIDCTLRACQLSLCILSSTN